MFAGDLPIVDKPLPRFLDDAAGAKLLRASRADPDPLARLIVELLARTGMRNVLDYTVDETGNQVIEGSRTEPVKFEEYWTFVRPVGPNSWKLSAIQQAP